MTTIFDLFGAQVYCIIIRIFKRIDPQLRIYAYPLNAPICHPVIFIIKGSAFDYTICYLLKSIEELH